MSASVIQAADEQFEAATVAPARETIADKLGIMGEVRLVSGALIFILIIVLVISEVSGAVNVTGGPFDSVMTSVESTGVSALVLLVVGILVVAAVAIMRIMGQSGFGGR